MSSCVCWCAHLYSGRADIGVGGGCGRHATDDLLSLVTESPPSSSCCITMGPASEKLNCIRIEAGKIFYFHDQNSEQSVVIVTLCTIILTTCNASRHSQFLASHWPG